MCFSMIKLAMITECWTPQSSHRDTFFSIYLVIKPFGYKVMTFLQPTIVVSTTIGGVRPGHTRALPG